MNYNQLGFDSFDRSSETYACVSAISNSSNRDLLQTKTINSIKIPNGDVIKMDTDGVVYKGESLTRAFEELNKKVLSISSELCDFYNNFNSIDKRLKAIEGARVNTLRVNRSMFKTLKYGGR